jgi:hypothetical protein
MLLAIADVPAVATILDRGPVPELARAAEFLRAIRPPTVKRRIEEGALQARHRSIDGTLTPARDAGKSVFSGAAEGCPVTWG